MKTILSTLAASPARLLASPRSLSMAAVAAAIFAIAAPAQAVPVNGVCHVTTYYADASMTTQVGQLTNCPGDHRMTGRKTPFFEVDNIQIGTGPRPKPPGQGPFPCEFQQNCVTNLPTPIPVAPWPPKKKP